MRNNKITILTTLAFIAISSLVACTKNPYNLTVKGYAPIYENTENSKIKSMPAQAYTNSGKIYQKGNTTYQIDNELGIHVIDCNNVQAPVKIAFLSIKGISEMAIKDNILYTDNGIDLVAIDISDINNIKEVDRIKDAYEISSRVVPPHTGSYFECVDQTKGRVIGWESKTLHNPKCKTY
jgi:hypothetical protein